MQRTGPSGICGRRGFTMIEMLTVIAIIAILAGILFPVFATVRRNVHKATCTSNLHEIYQALRIYKDDHGVYPESLFGFSGQNVPASPVTPLGLYPNYVKSTAVFHCPLSPYPLNSTVTVAGIAPNRAGFRQPYQQRIYPAWDSYDGQIEPPNVGNDKYYVKYTRHWSNLNPGFGDIPKQLLYKNPPDDTVVTWCTYHRDYDRSTGGPQTGSLDIVLFLDGHVKPIPSTKMWPITVGNGQVPADHSYLVNRD
jgi:prepilin-type N-terminal cleavage/methylation domain-containing protein